MLVAVPALVQAGHWLLLAFARQLCFGGISFSQLSAQPLAMYDPLPVAGGLAVFAFSLEKVAFAGLEDVKMKA